MSDIINNGYQIWPVYYGHDVKYRVVKFISGEVAYERQFRSRDEADGYVIWKKIKKDCKEKWYLQKGNPVL